MDNMPKHFDSWTELREWMDDSYGAAAWSWDVQHYENGVFIAVYAYTSMDEREPVWAGYIE